MALEQMIEKRFVNAVKHAGGLALKFASPGCAGVPDRIILLPGGRVAFAEIKAPGQHPRPLQSRRIQQLQQLGFDVHIIDNPNQIPRIIHALQTP